MDVYSFFLGRAQITEMCLRKVKWIAVSYWKRQQGLTSYNLLLQVNSSPLYNCLEF